MWAQYLDILFLFELGDDSDDLIGLPEDIMHRPAILNELLGKLPKNLLSNIQHLVFGDRLLLVLLILVSRRVCLVGRVS